MSFPCPELASPAPVRLTIEDWWFAALEGRIIHVAGIDYSLAVVGIHRGSESDLWVQLAPFDATDREMLRADRGVTLHCRIADAPEDALLAVHSHLASNGVRQGGRLEIVRR